MIFYVTLLTWPAVIEKCSDGMRHLDIEDIGQLFNLTCQSCRIQRKSCFSKVTVLGRM